MTVPGTPWREASALVFVDDLDAPVLDDADAHHLGRVLRLRGGAVVGVADGSGRWRPCTFDGRSVLEPAGEVLRPGAPPPPVTVGFAPPKGDRPELVVQKLTELGVDRVVVLATDRTVVRWTGERAERHLARLRRVAREAAQQCRRLTLPTVEAGALADLLAVGAAVADPGGRAPRPGDRCLLVGPEGGWSEAERSAMADRRTPLVSLSPHVLRAETAAIAAGVVATLDRVGPPGEGGDGSGGDGNDLAD